MLSSAAAIPSTPAAALTARCCRSVSEPRRVPRHIDVDQIVAAGLQVDPFARGIGADQDAEWLGRRLGVEGELDGLAAIGSGGSGENIDPLVDAIRVLQRLQQ